MNVAECYVHVRYERLSREEFDDLSERLLGIATNLARGVKRGREMDFVLEEGTLWQKIAIGGALLLGVYHAVAEYKDFRESAPLLIHEGVTFSEQMIEKFHTTTATEPADEISKRITSRDMNRLRRILSEFDKVSESHLPAAEIKAIRQRIIRDLAGLAKANPGDPEIAALISSLPKRPIRDLPTTPRDAIRMDTLESRREPSYPGDFKLEGEVKMIRLPPFRGRRRFEKHVPLGR